MSKVEIFRMPWNCYQKSKFLPRIEIFAKNRNFGQRFVSLQLCLKNKSEKSQGLKNTSLIYHNGNFHHNDNFVKSRNFYKKSKVLSKVEIYVESRNFCQKSKFLSQVEIFIKSRNFGQRFVFLQWFLNEKSDKSFIPR
mgnify:CR=1 FL=1